jgi:hypothetical protein
LQRFPRDDGVHPGQGRGCRRQAKMAARSHDEQNNTEKQATHRAVPFNINPATSVN